MINKNFTAFKEVKFTTTLNEKLPTFIKDITVEAGRDWVNIKNMEL